VKGVTVGQVTLKGKSGAKDLKKRMGDRKRQVRRREGFEGLKALV
jgi:hypothetical protein